MTVSGFGMECVSAQINGHPFAIAMRCDADVVVLFFARVTLMNAVRTLVRVCACVWDAFNEFDRGLSTRI